MCTGRTCKLHSNCIRGQGLKWIARAFRKASHVSCFTDKSMWGSRGNIRKILETTIPPLHQVSFSLFMLLLHNLYVTSEIWKELILDCKRLSKRVCACNSVFVDDILQGHNIVFMHCFVNLVFSLSEERMLVSSCQTPFTVDVASNTQDRYTGAGFQENLSCKLHLRSLFMYCLQSHSFRR